MSLLQRAGAVVTAAVLATTTLSGPAAAAVDPAPVEAGSAWLGGELTDGLMHNPNFGGFDDYGLSIDAAFALAAVGGHAATVEQISDAIAAHVDSYTTGVDFGSSDVYAGAVAKAVVMAQTAGADPTSYGGVDLVDRLEGLVSTDPTTLGRIEDQSDFGDYANVLGQAFAAQGLEAAGSARAADALAFLLQQQCSEGYFRLNFTADKEAVDQSCDGGDDAASAPDTDATAAVMIALAGQAADPVVGAALDDAEAWLLATQRANGSFGGGPSTEAPNANSTGLAAWALGDRGETAAAEEAAVWLRALQTANVGGCTPWADRDLGAVAYDRASFLEGRADNITDATSDQWRRASAQTLPALTWAPHQAAATAPVTAERAGQYDYFAAGSKVPVEVTGLTPGDLACGWRRTFHTSDVIGRGGVAVLDLRMPGGTAVRTFRLGDSDQRLTADFSVLGRLDVPFTLGKDRVRRGGTQIVRVRGLEPREFVSVQIAGSQVAGRADLDGRFVARLPVGTEAGKVAVRVFGQFADLRHGRKTFTVTR